MKSKGFTLIELLVVIAIIGILASIVLVSFPGAQKKAKDSRIVSAVSQLRTVMVYLQANEGNYDKFYCATDCTGCLDTDLQSLCDEIKSQGGTPTFTRTGASASTAGCIFSPLTQKTSYWYCADSTGKAGFTTTAPTGAGYCVGTTSGVCPPVTS